MSPFDAAPFIAFASGHVCVAASTDGYFFICPKHGQMEGVMPAMLARLLVRENTCTLCSHPIGDRVGREFAMRIMRQIIGDRATTYSLP